MYLRKVLVRSSIIVAWVVICSGAWYVSARDDYQDLAAATACHESGSVSANCANLREVQFYKGEVDRKARNSRLASAGGAVVILVLMMVSRRRRQARSTA